MFHRVLLLSPMPPPPGGISTWTAQVRDLAQTDREITLHVLDSAVRWRPPTHHSVVLRLIGGSVHAVLQITKVIAAIFRFRPDVIHLCSSAEFALVKDICILAICRIARVRGIIHFRFGRIPQLARSGGWEWWLLQRAANLSAAILVLDRPSRETLLASGGVRVHQLPNMVDPRIGERPASSVPRRVLFAGHILPAKGCAQLVCACASLRREFPDLTLRLVGPYEAGYAKELREMAKDLAASTDWLDIMDAVSRDEVLREMGLCEVFCLPSHTEGFPNVLLEAMAMQRPIVATSVGAIPEITGWSTSEPCAVCVTPGDVTALIAGIGHALRDRAAAARMAEHALDRCKRLYSSERVYERLRALWMGKYVAEDRA